MLTFVSLTWSESTAETQSHVFVRTVSDVLQWLVLRHPGQMGQGALDVRVFGPWTIPDLMPDQPYWGTQWYIDHAYDAESKSVVAPLFLELVRHEPWQQTEPHYDLALLAEPMTAYHPRLVPAESRGACLSASIPGLAAVVSTAPLADLPSPLAEAALARAVRHALGHALGVPAGDRNNDVERHGAERHCTNRCVMRHADSVAALVALTRDEEDLGWPYCDACTADLHSVMVRHSHEWS
ncbi:MAG: hypothetical protein J7M15_02985 [Anaerolineae bacterium]|nr:hypothetical protein [Anaerolineae bacterium]